MTTPNNDATANNQPVDTTVEQIADKVEEKLQKQPETPEVSPNQSPDGDVKNLIREEIRSAFGKEQGRIAGQYGQQQGRLSRQIRDEVRGVIEEVVKPVKSQLDTWEQGRISQLEPEEQAAYWQHKYQENSTQPVAEPQQEQAAGWGTLTQQDQSDLASYAQAVLETQGLDRSLMADQRLWQGASESMSVDQLKILARQNVSALKGQPQQTAQPAQSAQASTAPTTSGAPASPRSGYDTRTDLYQAFREGKVDSNEFRNIKRQKGW